MAETQQENDYGTLIEGHTYDGIEEYDNPMPRWWLWTFYLTIAWSVFYVIGINVGWVNTYKATLRLENAKIDALQSAAAESAMDVDPEFLAELIAEEKYLDEGKDAFAAYCAACHRDDGGGLIGPNLTDSSWLHGGSPMDIYTVADKGVPDKGMPAWGTTLKSEQLLGVVVFIDSIRDTNVDGGKEAEGEEYQPE